MRPAWIGALRGWRHGPKPPEIPDRARPACPGGSTFLHYCTDAAFRRRARPGKRGGESPNPSCASCACRAETRIHRVALGDGQHDGGHCCRLDGTGA
jgi:hypothetical protein